MLFATSLFSVCSNFSFPFLVQRTYSLLTSHSVSLNFLLPTPPYSGFLMLQVFSIPFSVHLLRPYSSLNPLSLVLPYSPVFCLFSISLFHSFYNSFTPCFLLTPCFAKFTPARSFLLSVYFDIVSLLKSFYNFLTPSLLLIKFPLTCSSLLPRFLCFLTLLSSLLQLTDFLFTPHSLFR